MRVKLDVLSRGPVVFSALIFAIFDTLTEVRQGQQQFLPAFFQQRSLSIIATNAVEVNIKTRQMQQIA
jgi:hypothetical protein